PYGCTRGRCHPPHSDQQTSTMWSVKNCPKPGLSRIASRCSSLFAFSLRVTWNVRSLVAIWRRFWVMVARLLEGVVLLCLAGPLPTSVGGGLHARHSRLALRERVRPVGRRSPNRSRRSCVRCCPARRDRPQQPLRCVAP